MNATALSQRWLDAARALVNHPRAPGTLCAMIVVVLAMQAAGLTWALLPEAPAARRIARVDAPATADPDQSGPGPAVRLAELHLFGAIHTASGSGESSAAPTDAPETKLNLTLKGVYAPGSGNGLAIIAAGGGGEKVYAVGDSIAGSAEITGIYGDRVVLRRNGQAETLRMALADAAPPRPTASRSDASAQEQQIARHARDLRQQLLENPVELARMVRFQPYVRDGELVGYRVQPRQADARMLADLGLRPSDVITRLNGRPLTDPRQANEALQSLRQARTIQVTFLRDGQQQQMNIPIGPTQ